MTTGDTFYCYARGDGATRITAAPLLRERLSELVAADPVLSERLQMRSERIVCNCTVAGPLPGLGQVHCPICDGRGFYIDVAPVALDRVADIRVMVKFLRSRGFCVVEAAPDEIELEIWGDPKEWTWTVGNRGT